MNTLITTNYGIWYTNTRVVPAVSGWFVKANEWDTEPFVGTLEDMEEKAKWLRARFEGMEYTVKEYPTGETK